MGNNSNLDLDVVIIPLYINIIRREEIMTSPRNQFEEAAYTLLASPYGIHALIIYSDMSTLRKFWSFYAKKSIEEKNELLFLAPFYETVNSVRETLSKEGFLVDVSKYKKYKRSLIVVDAFEKYHDQDDNIFDVRSLLKANEALVYYADILKKNGVSVLGDLGAFFFKNQIQSLIDYEYSLSTEFDTNFKGICLYHTKDFDRLSADQRKKVTNCHKITISI